MSVPFLQVRRQLRAHWFRNLLTVGAVSLAVLLFAFLVSLIRTLDAQVEDSSGERVVVQSAVSLFVDLPLDYQTKIESVPGVMELTKWQWFGAYHKDPNSGFFPQFAVDPDRMLRMYEADIEIEEGPPGASGDLRAAVARAMAEEKRAALVGVKTMEKFGWKVGDTVQLICTIFPHPSGGAWDFNIVGSYSKKKDNVDDQTMFFRFDYLEDTFSGGDAAEAVGTGTYFVQTAPGASAAVIDGIDALFANGPQRTRTFTEAAFQQGFVSMLGNLPLFLGTIGGAVLFAVFFSVVNAMLIAGRQRIRETGILKALGFSDGSIGLSLLLESLLLTSVGGLLGVAVVLGASQALKQGLAGFFPNFEVGTGTLLQGFAIAVLMGLVAGIAPMLHLMRLRPTAALRNEG